MATAVVTEMLADLQHLTRLAPKAELVYFHSTQSKNRNKIYLVFRCIDNYNYSADSEIPWVFRTEKYVLVLIFIKSFLWIIYRGS